jgi:hypothetical protein
MTEEASQQIGSLALTRSRRQMQKTYAGHKYRKIMEVINIEQAG